MPPKSARSGRGAKIPEILFNPFKITPTTAELAVTMLQSMEPDILCKTLRALSIFQKQEENNKVLLHELNVVKYIIPHIEHPHFNVRRFALLNLALMCLLPGVPEGVLKNHDVMKRLAHQLMKVEDIYTLEYTSLCISRLTKDHEGCQQLIEANILGMLFKRMKDSPDPDVQMNCLQTLTNLLQDPMTSRPVTKNSFFSWDSILVLTQSKFIGLQNGALKIVGILLARYEDTLVQNKFRASTGVYDLCDLLERYEFRDIHAEVLKILKVFAVPGENATHLYKTDCIPRLQNYLALALPQLKRYCLSVLTTLSATVHGRDAIMATETDLIFCESILCSNLDMLADASLGVANMCAILYSAVRMHETGVVEGLCSIIQDDSIPWYYVRINTLKALSAFNRLLKPAAILVSKAETFRSLRQINIDYKDNPEEAQILALDVFQSLLVQNEVAMKVMLQDTFVKELLEIVSRVNIKLQIPAVKLLSAITQHELGKDLFTSSNGEQVITDKLRIHHNGFRNALCQLIIDSVTYEGAEVYLDLGTITYMLENLPARFSVSKWEKASLKILEKHPSAKLGYLGRLDPEDVTNDGFYVPRRLGDSFPSITTIMSKTSPNVNPVYIAILYPQNRRYSLDLGVRIPHSQLLRGSLNRISISNRNSMALLPKDENLKEYVLRLRHMFGDKDRSIQYVEIINAHYDVRERKACEEVRSNLKRKAHILAEFVVQEMNGSNKEDACHCNCNMPNSELHIADLINKFKSGVIGIGFVKNGGMLERAILYKVLADRLGIPCALYRKYAVAWCAIAVPEADKLHPEKEEKYPAKYLRVNYVVDLNDTVKDRLYREGSFEASKIIGPPLPPYVVGKQHQD